MNRDYAAQHEGDSTLAARVRSYELAARMQLTVPEAIDIARETDATSRRTG